MHLTGQGAEVDYTLAAKYFKRSMEMNQDWNGIADAYFYSGTSEIHSRSKVEYCHQHSGRQKFRIAYFAWHSCPVRRAAVPEWLRGRI